MSYYDQVGQKSAFESLWSTARKRPEALLLFAAGFALLLTKGASSRSGINTQDIQRNVTSKAREAQDYVSDLASQAYDSASSMIEPVRDYANRASAYVSDASGSAVSKASDMADQAQRMAKTNIDHYVQDQPLAIGLLTLAVGAAIGAALPATEVENRTLGAQSDLLVRKAREVASEQIEQLKAAAGQVGEKAKAAANSATDKTQRTTS